jgi:hypothetical protein
MRSKILIAIFGVALAGAASFGCGSSSTNSNTGGSGGGAGVGGIAGSTGGAGGSTGGAGGGGMGGMGGGGMGGTTADCFMGTPTTHEELINACTTAEKIDKTVKLPNNLKVGDMLPALQ